YTPLPGLPRLRKAMAAASTACTGIETEPDEIIATQGGQAALYAAVQTVLDPGDHAIVVAPYYATYPNTFSAAGATFTVVETPAEDGFQPRADMVRAALKPNTRAILINTPNNPTGAVYSRERLEELAAICKEHDLWLLSDEVYWTLGGGEHISPRSLPGMAERTLVINSMSKSHGMTGWRMGWLTGPTEMIRLLTDLNLVTTYGLPAFISIACAEALENHYGVKEIAERYAARRALMLEAIRGMNDVT
ncbi:MAG: aminotransferase class I/II-fold pyridoxal phosphate-dependent enzyme, partial [Mesorhizobium sp.]